MSDPVFLDSLESIIVAGVALTTEALADAAHDTDLTLPMWRVLVVLGSTDDGATVSEVAQDGSGSPCRPPAASSSGSPARPRRPRGRRP